MKFNVTIEALKRANVEIEASDEDDAKAKVERKLMDEGVSFIEFDEMWDSIKVGRAVEQ